MAQYLGSTVTKQTSLAALSTASAAIAGSTWYSSCQKAVDDDETSPFRVEVHLMDKIQQKAYLASAKDGIPSTLRILAIDLPEMRTDAFSGDCRLAHDKIFVDDVASSKVITVDNDGNVESGTNTEDQEKKSNRGKHAKLKITQKALVKSLVQCRSRQSQQRVGVELLEASISDLNKFKLRKTHQVGNFKYDPGKYYASKEQRGDTEDEEISEADMDVPSLDKSGFEEEIEAPWNQYAWAEEMRLRINGQIGFESSLDKASRWNRYLFGQSYKISVHSVYRFWEWPLPAFAKSDPNGVDGRNPMNCRACNKPHAVIANGAALQKVPSSLRLLQKVCKKADVPLFVIHDPRVWGGNTHGTLPEALRDMRGTIKNRVIEHALKQQGSTAFTRGRILGQAETETKWQLKEQKRRSKEMFDIGKRRGRKSDGDWSQYDSARLERRLIERGVIKETTKSDGEGSSLTERSYTNALIALAGRCMGDVKEQQKEAIGAVDISPEVSSSPGPNSASATFNA